MTLLIISPLTLQPSRIVFRLSSFSGLMIISNFFIQHDLLYFFTENKGDSSFGTPLFGISTLYTTGFFCQINFWGEINKIFVKN